jgi:hypothetical protein
MEYKIMKRNYVRSLPWKQQSIEAASGVAVYGNTWANFVVRWVYKEETDPTFIEVFLVTTA